MIHRFLERGSLNITEDVFSMLTKIGLDEVDGIVGTKSGIKEGVSRVVYNKGNHKGITIEEEDKEIIITVKIAVNTNRNILTVCRELQHFIKNEIECMTGVVVKKVNVQVEQLVIEN